MSHQQQGIEKIDRIYDLLNLVTNQTIGTTRFKRIEAKAPPMYVGQGKNNTFIFSLNLSLEVQ